MVELDTICVNLDDGEIVWVCVLFFEGTPHVITIAKEKKLKYFRTILGFPKELPKCSTLSLKEFQEYCPIHPILIMVKDWEQMGIPIKSVATPEFS